MVKAIHRLMEYLKYKGLKQSLLQKEIGLGNAYFSTTLKRNSAIGSDVIEKISYSYPDLSIDWLITGKGEMLKGEDAAISEKLRECEETKKVLEKILIEKTNEVERLKKHTKFANKL